MLRNRVIPQTVVISAAYLLVLYLIGESGVKLEAIHIFIALVPFIILLVVSGKLKEIRGPGGTGLILRDEVRKSVSLEQSEEKVDYQQDEVIATKCISFAR